MLWWALKMTVELEASGLTVWGTTGSELPHSLGHPQLSNNENFMLHADIWGIWWAIKNISRISWRNASHVWWGFCCLGNTTSFYKILNNSDPSNDKKKKKKGKEKNQHKSFIMSPDSDSEIVWWLHLKLV